MDKTPPDKSSSSQKPQLFRDPWFIWLAAVLFLLYYFSVYQQPAPPDTISYTQFVKALEQQRVASVEIRGADVQGVYSGSGSGTATSTGKRADFRTRMPAFAGDTLLQTLEDGDVDVTVLSDESPVWLSILLGFLPWVLMIALFVFLSRSLQSRMGGGGLLNFSQSKARRYQRSDSGPTYDDVAGLEGAKQDLGDIIAYLKEPARFQALGAKIPKGVLMMGAPGTGKTLLAKATAAEAGVPFFSITGSEFIELYVGVGASRVRDMFQMARKEAPALIFIDEIDSVGRVRGTGLGGGNDEREQTLNQILAEMDGFEPEDVVVVLAATNRPDVLDPALLRPGRFDRKVILDLPDKTARREIFKVHTRHTPLADDVSLDDLANLTVGFSGADIENLVNEAALRAAREQHSNLSADDFAHARDKVLMGEERPHLLNPGERHRIACHEAGHGLVTWFSAHADPLQKITIVPRGRALGMTEQMAKEERHNFDEPYLMDRLNIFLAGRGAEKLMFGNTSSGAAEDLKQATRLARQMVVNWGMSETLGPIGFAEGETHPFLGRELTEPRPYSEALAQQIDSEVSRLLKQAEEQVQQLLQSHRPQLQMLIDALLEQESLQAAEIEQCLGTVDASSSTQAGNG
ncbi:ATP-dependent zinc metalloprotease FtsH [Pseudomaricurvus sp. HS19]|uniref:ATP-dependent zinc metalloprotease FtsH n=1 Tax=Pseudomaricurvus sp. HS19 TaxID=2692626 RepID=UPI00136B4D9E|nr:ATP-dependent zinc metalloprotease FtsH [Pseudomaricurvus sp. HS19]MYM62764.1 ATP-dependent zinc metalloprotease FtsH [Pseudomaricurvus sp. HS19]